MPGRRHIILQRPRDCSRYFSFLIGHLLSGIISSVAFVTIFSNVSVGRFGNISPICSIAAPMIE